MSTAMFPKDFNIEYPDRERLSLLVNLKLTFMNRQYAKTCRKIIIVSCVSVKRHATSHFNDVISLAPVFVLQFKTAK